MALKTTRCCALLSLVAFLLIPKLGKRTLDELFLWTIFNEDSDLVSKNVVICSLHCTVVSFTNKAQFNAGFSKRLKIKRRCCAILDPTVMSQIATQVWVTVFISWSLLLCLFLQIVWYVLSYSCFYLNHSSVHLWGIYTVKHTQLIANHSSGQLLPSLQSTTPIQTERSDEGG